MPTMMKWLHSSLHHRGLFVSQEGWGERRRKRAGHEWKGKSEKRGLCHIMCGSLAGFVVPWFWLNQATIWTLLKGVVKMIV